MSGPDWPQLEAFAVPLTPEQVARAIDWICDDLESVHIDDMKFTMKHGHPRPAAEQHRSETNPRGSMAGPWFEPQVTLEPLTLVFHYHWKWVSSAIRMAPENFDRSIPRQDALYQKCIAIMEVLRDGPLRPRSTDFDCLTIRNFKFWRNKSEEERRVWARLIEMWRTHQ